ncbi:MAG: dienelactone hydrolase family protein [Acidimicrobiales bacterium]
MEEADMATTVMLETKDGEMALYDAAPEGTPKGAVVVIQEAFGVNDHIEDVTRRFAAAGYRAVAPHLFYRTGDPVLDYGNIEKVMEHMQALSREGILADLDATLEHLSSGGLAPKRTGIVGFCMGGTVAVLAAATKALGAAATFYGGGVAEGRFGMPSLVELTPQLKTPWLGLYGDLDQGIPVEQVEALRAALPSAPVPTELVRYAEAGHGFHCDLRDSYHEASAKDAWRRTLAWFDKYIETA